MGAAMGVGDGGLGRGPMTNRRRVLLVDDEEGIRRGLARSLGRYHEIHTASDGHQGIVAVERDGPFVAVVADLQMPGMDGLAMLREVARIAPRTPRILFTGTLDASRLVDAAVDLELFRVIYKPASTADLLAALAAAALEYDRPR